MVTFSCRLAAPVLAGRQCPPSIVDSEPWSRGGGPIPSLFFSSSTATWVIDFSHERMDVKGVTSDDRTSIAASRVRGINKQINN